MDPSVIRIPNPRRNIDGTTACVSSYCDTLAKGRPEVGRGSGVLVIVVIGVLVEGARRYIVIHSARSPSGFFTTGATSAFTAASALIKPWP
jgi:hypothetical protein